MSLKKLGMGAFALVLVCLMFQTMVAPFQADASPTVDVDPVTISAATIDTVTIDTVTIDTAEVDSVSVLTATGAVGSFGNNPFLARFGNSPFLP